MLLLDEPARGLDYELRMDLYRVLGEVRAQYNIPIVLVTHDRDEAFRMGERLAIYNAGRIVQEGSPESVFSAPRDRGVAKLLGYGNIFEGAIERLDPAGGTSLVRAGNIALTLDYLPGRFLGDRVEFCIPAHRVKLGPGENALEGECVGEARLPSSVRLTFRADGWPESAIECEIPRAAFNGAARNATLSLPRQAIHVFEKGGAT